MIDPVLTAPMDWSDCSDADRVDERESGHVHPDRAGRPLDDSNTCCCSGVAEAASISTIMVT